jgi:hypothetical protein
MGHPLPVPCFRRGADAVPNDIREIRAKTGIPPAPAFGALPAEISRILYRCSEWHFERSSDTVIDLLRETKIGVSRMLLGRSVQLALPFFYGIFREDSKVLHALERYILYWMHWQRQSIPEQIYAKKYQRMAPALRQRVAKIRQYMLEEQPSDQLTSVERTWKEHISEFRRSTWRTCSVLGSAFQPAGKTFLTP